MREGTTVKGARCRRPGNPCCPSHKAQAKFVRDGRSCQSLLTDGRRCTRETVDGSFCSIAEHSQSRVCEGYSSFGIRCVKAAEFVADDRVYCEWHVYQADESRICQGVKVQDGVKCMAKCREGSNYCRPMHEPTFKRWKFPREFRLTQDLSIRKQIITNANGVDFYTDRPVDPVTQEVDHVVELQMTAHCVNRMWRDKRDSYGSDEPLQHVVEVLRDGPANDSANLRLTSMAVNRLKGTGCTTFLEARYSGDVVKTFTTCLQEAAIRRTTHTKLDRQTSGFIRRAIRSTLKQLQFNINDENDNNNVMDATMHEFQELRIDLKE